TPNLTWCLALGPFALAVAGLATGSAKSGQRQVGGGAAWIAGFALAMAAAAGLCVAVNGPLVTGTVGFAGVGLGFYVDTLAAIMFVLVAFVGL
ncbi:hypothetical protein OU789_16835, partial [Halocynthiibacter sp. C4]|nr:hypothetical protein [Halocynthiibacter sp. C4]